MEGKLQARAPKSHLFGGEAFLPSEQTTVRWLGNGGLFINSRGTCLLIDPVLTEMTEPLLIEIPVAVEEIPRVDGILITHSDGDHYSVPTCRALREVCGAYHTTAYVAELMQEEQIPGEGHSIGESFSVGGLHVTVTPADHTWQNDGQFGTFERVFLKEDCCGFWIETPDGTIWAPGDSRLMEEHLRMPAPDLILFDFSDDPWHIGLEDAVRLANTYPTAKLLLSHWGTVDAPDRKPFNADPADLQGRIVNPERVLLLAAGEPWTL